MEHIAIGSWLSSEISNNLHLLEEILHVIEQLQDKRILHRQFSGQQFLLILNQEEAEVVDQSLADEFEAEMPDDNLDWYDEESRAGCGLEDFQQLLQSWHSFIAE